MHIQSQAESELFLKHVLVCSYLRLLKTKSIKQCYSISKILFLKKCGGIYFEEKTILGKQN